MKAAWLLIGFGLAYTAWGVVRAVRRRPHTHWHQHEDGTVHCHRHSHTDDHAHVHTDRRRTTGWALFIVFVFGPCEVLIPQLMYPAAVGSWWGLTLVTTVFAATTIGTMTIAVSAGYWGLSRISLKPLERASHVFAGLAVTACGLAVRFGL